MEIGVFQKKKRFVIIGICLLSIIFPYIKDNQDFYKLNERFTDEDVGRMKESTDKFTTTLSMCHFDKCGLL